MDIPSHPRAWCADYYFAYVQRHREPAYGYTYGARRPPCHCPRGRSYGYPRQPHASWTTHRPTSRDVVAWIHMHARMREAQLVKVLECLRSQENLEGDANQHSSDLSQRRFGGDGAYTRLEALTIVVPSAHKYTHLWVVGVAALHAGRLVPDQVERWGMHRRNGTVQSALHILDLRLTVDRLDQPKLWDLYPRLARLGRLKRMLSCLQASVTCGV